jgi:hypothetical protein
MAIQTFISVQKGVKMKKKILLTIFVSVLLLSSMPSTTLITRMSSTKFSNLLTGHNSMPLTHTESSFQPIVANVHVLFPNGQPMPDVTVVAINHEYYFRYSERTNATGWVTFRAMLGNWSFFAYPGRLIKGIGYFPCVFNKRLTNPTEEVVLKPEREVHIELVSSIDRLTDFDMTDVSVVENNIGFFEAVGTTGFTDQNNLTLFTQSNITARISLHKMAQLNKPGVIFVSEPVRLEGNVQINITNSNTARLRLEFRDINNNLASGAHVQFHVMERSWRWSPYIVDYSFSNLTFITSLSNFWIFCGVDVFKDAIRYRMLFNSKHWKPDAREQTVFRFGGTLDSRVLITPRAASSFKPATHVMLYTTDASNNVVMEVWKFGVGRLKPHLVVTADGGKKKETEMELAFVSKILEEFDPSENPRYQITYDFGPFGNGTFEGGLYDSEPLQMIIHETDRLIPQSPAIDYDLRVAQVDSYENLFQSMEELIGVPTDYKIGVISNIMHAGFEDEILHGFKLELPLEIMFPPTWPLGDGFIADEMGHGRIHKPPTNFFMIRNYGEAYATLMGYKARARLFGDERLFDFLMGLHDLFLRHQHGDPVQSGGEYIEIIQFITYYIDKNYGWDAHKRMILEWENAFCPLRDILSSNGFSDIEQMAIIYSYIVGDNLAWLFELGNFDVTEDTVNTGLNLVLQDQQQTGNDELKIGETTAVTYTASVPIMLRRVPSSLSKINVTLAFDHSLARVLQVYKRDLTDNDGWNLTTTSDAPGQLTIELQGSEPITGPGSIVQVNFELIPTQKSELQITVSSASTDSGNTVVAEGGRIILSQLSVTRPKNLPFEIVWDEETYYVTMSSNSTIEHLLFDQSVHTISFDVTAPIGTVGFCNLTIPKVLLRAEPLEAWEVSIDDSPPLSLIVTENDTHTFLYFTYSHTTRRVKIMATRFPLPEVSLSVNTFKNDVPIVSNITLFDENETIIETVENVSAYDWLLPIGIYHVQASILYNNFVYVSDRTKVSLTKNTELGINFQFGVLTVFCLDVYNRALQDCTVIFARKDEERTNQTDSSGSTVLEAYYGNWTVKVYWMGVLVGEKKVNVDETHVEVNIRCGVGDFVVVVVNQYGDLVKANVTLTNTTYGLSFSGYLDGVIENLTFVQIPLIDYTLRIKDDFGTQTYSVDTSQTRRICLEVMEIVTIEWVERALYLLVIGTLVGSIVTRLIIKRRLRVEQSIET